MRARSLPILMYHSVEEVPAGPYASLAVPPSTFAAHLACLRREGFAPLTVTDAFARPLPPRPVVLTFDDGLADFYSGALPLLRQYAVPATLYVVTDRIGDRARWLADLGEGERKLLTWSQLEEIQAAGIECGAHTRTHPQLDRLPASRLGEEIAGSRTVLEQRLGTAVRGFAYPYGFANRVVREAVRHAGFTTACVVEHRMASARSPRLALPRIVITPQIGEQRLLRLLAGRDLTLFPAVRLPLQRLGRSLSGALRAG